jgi:hypothetical protein
MQHQFSQPWLNDFYFVCRDLGFPIVVAAVIIGAVGFGVRAVWNRLSPLYVDILTAQREREESRIQEHKEQTKIINDFTDRTLTIQEATQMSVKQSLDLQRKTYILLERMTGVSERATDVAATAAETAAIAAGVIPTTSKMYKSGK